MICPRCNNVNLVISNTKGVEIDFCPNCKGVWLDRGELEKIIERSNSYENQFSSNYEHNGHHDKHHDSHHDNQYGHGNKSNHKKGFLSDLFDF